MKHLLRIVFFIFLCSARNSCYAYDSTQIKKELRAHINALTSKQMGGRGYVVAMPHCGDTVRTKGVAIAADYIADKFAEYGLEPLGVQGYRQAYSFPVNTFPGAIWLKAGRKKLKGGKDYIVDAASSPFLGEKMPVTTIDLSKTGTADEWGRLLQTFDTEHVWLLTNKDTFCKTTGIKPRSMAALLPRGCFIIPEKNKLTWTVSQDTIAATVYYVNETALPRKMGKATVNVESKLEKNFLNENIIACVPGNIKDSFIVFSAHYDHLGMMGGNAIFPGASDNASGTAMLLYLAEYFAKHPQKYTMVFIAFSGEEAGLLGSEFFVNNPTFPLQNTRFLTNIDIMGDATDGVTVVNATVCPHEFDMLNRINAGHHYLPAIKSRGKAANSDHYHFSEKGVPAFFLYSNGGKGHYHDVYDIASEVTLSNIAGVSKLLIDFVAELQK